MCALSLVNKKKSTVWSDKESPRGLNFYRKSESPLEEHFRVKFQNKHFRTRTENVAKRDEERKRKIVFTNAKRKEEDIREGTKQEFLWINLYAIC